MPQETEPLSTEDYLSLLLINPAKIAEDEEAYRKLQKLYWEAFEIRKAKVNASK